MLYASLEHSWPIKSENYDCVVAAHLNYGEPLIGMIGPLDLQYPTIRLFSFIKIIERLNMDFRALS